MSKYWQKTLQDTVGRTVIGISDSAARLKQGWADKPQTSPELSSQSSSPRTAHTSPEKVSDKQQYLRLPLESARRLRWYDREDLSSLVEANLRDKRLLQSTISALRQVIHESGVSEVSLETDLREKLEDVEKQAFCDEGVASVLLASLQSEAADMHAKLDAQASEIAVLKQRLADGTSAQDSTVQNSRPAAEQPVVLQIVLQSESVAGEYVEHAVDARELGRLASHRPTPSAFESVKGDLTLEHDGVGNEADLDRLRGSQPGDAEMLASPSQAGETPPQSSPQMPAEHDDATSALLGKLRRVEEERREYFEEIARLNDLLRAHEIAGAEAKSTVSRLQTDLDAARKGRADIEEAAEAKLQELRARVAASQSQHTDMLRRAQDICIEAEEKAASLEKRADRAESRAAKAETELKEVSAEVRRLTSELKVREKEKDKLEARALTAEGLLAEAKQKGELEKGGAMSSALAAAKKASDEREAELRKAMKDGEQKLQTRIQRLESDNADLRRALTRAQAEVSALEGRLAEAEATESALHADLRAAEAAVGEREDLEAHIAALQDRLEETRGEQGQLANYKQIAKELEAERAKVEDEVVATVRIATSLESRLQAANAAKAKAEHLAALAGKQAAEAERRVEREVARRLDLIGADETQWPAAAREAVARQSKKLEAMHAMLNGLQNELDAEQHNLAAEQASKQAAQSKLAAAEERLERLDREARDAIHRLERKVSAIQAEASEWQRETASAEAELSRLTAVQRKANPFQRTSSGSTPRRGGGNLHGLVSDREMTNGTTGPIDHLYLKNVLLKFLVAATQGRSEQCHVLLPAVATLLHANAQEFNALKGAISGQSSWWPQAA